MVGHPSSIHCKWSQSIRTGLAPSISQSSIGGVQVLVGIIHSGCGLPHAAAVSVEHAQHYASVRAAAALACQQAGHTNVPAQLRTEGVPCNVLTDLFWLVQG